MGEILRVPVLVTVLVAAWSVLCVPLGTVQASVQGPTPLWSVDAAGSSDLDSATFFGASPSPTGEFFVSGAIRGTDRFGAGDTAQSISASGALEAFLAKYSAKGDLVWITQSRGQPSTAQGAYPQVHFIGVAATPDGGAVVVGTLEEGTATFGTGSQEISVSAGPTGRQMVVAKYRGDGSLEWLQSSSGDTRSACTGFDVAVGPVGDVYVVGWTYGKVTFGSGSQTQTLGDNYLRGFAAKYSPDGRLVFAQDLSGSQEPIQSHAFGVAVGPDGSFSVVGSVDGGPFTLGSGTHSTTLPERGGFVARYDSDGTLQWAAGQAGIAQTDDVTQDESGRVFISGSFYDSLRVGQEGRAMTLASRGGDDVFVVGYGPDGDLLWAQSAGGKSDDWTGGLALSSSGTVAVGGLFHGEATFGSGSQTSTLSTTGQSAFLAGYSSSSGLLQWATQTTGRWSAQAQGVAATADGDVVLVGEFYYSIGFGDDYPDLTLTTGAFRSAFMARYSLPKASPPGTVTSLKATPAKGSIRVTWSPPSNMGGANSVTYQYQVGKQAWKSTAATSVTVKGKKGVKVTVNVRAVNEAGAGPSVSVSGVPK